MAGYAAKITPNRNPNAFGPSHCINRTRGAITALRACAPWENRRILGKDASAGVPRHRANTDRVTPYYAQTP